mmetsp:Transcript_7361/g.11571  ORF Transcript_7361/g.11571 Transcript_7361/m.11571 type:complete len:396 (+) Transcript_7361:421-1608(+)
MDLDKRLQRLEDAGFTNIPSLVKRYPQLLSLRTKRTMEHYVEAGLGLSYEDVVRMTEKCPAILGVNATKAVERLEDLLLVSSTTQQEKRRQRLLLLEVGMIVRSFPQALTYNIENRLHCLARLLLLSSTTNNNNKDCDPNTTSNNTTNNELDNSNKARVLLGKMVRKYPPILGYNLESRLALLEEAGISRSQSLKALPNFPQLVSYDIHSRMQKLHDAGLCSSSSSSQPPLLKQLVGTFPPLIGYDIEKKIQGLVTHVGVNRTQALTMIVNYPRIVQVSAETTAGPAARCLLRTYNNNATISNSIVVTLDYLVQHPRILTRSVPNCLEPRLQRLEELDQPLQLAPTTLVSLSNQAFDEQYGKLGDDLPPVPKKEQQQQQRRSSSRNKKTKEKVKS